MASTPASSHHCRRLEPVSSFASCQSGHLCSLLFHRGWKPANSITQYFSGPFPPQWLPVGLCQWQALEETRRREEGRRHLVVFFCFWYHQGSKSGRQRATPGFLGSSGSNFGSSAPTRSNPVATLSGWRYSGSQASAVSMRAQASGVPKEGSSRYTSSPEVQQSCLG